MCCVPLKKSAQWTRFNPTMIAVQKALHQDRIIGDVRSIYSDLSINFLGHVEETNRVFNPELAGGMLLDLGPYPMLWVRAHSLSLSRTHRHHGLPTSPSTRTLPSSRPHPLLHILIAILRVTLKVVHHLHLHSCITQYTTFRMLTS